MGGVLKVGGKSRLFENSPNGDPGMAFNGGSLISLPWSMYGSPELAPEGICNVFGSACDIFELERDT